MPASAAGHPFLERRELAAVNIGGPGAISVDGQRFEMGNKECLYIPMGSKDVTFEGEGARFYLASLPAHKDLPDQAYHAWRRPIRWHGAICQQQPAHHLPARHPGRFASAQLLLGLTVLEEGSVEHDAAASP